MTIEVDGASVRQLRSIVAAELGLHFGEDKDPFLAQTLVGRVQAARYASAGEYLSRLATPANQAGEFRALAAALTVPETFFFRGADQLRAFLEVVVPECLRARRGARELRILCAGCATGEEPYSLSILLRDEVPMIRAWTFSILGIDINPQLLEAAKHGRYSAWALRETLPGFRERCFRKEGQDFILQEGYREQVSFRQVNLARPPEDLFFPGTFDVIFCRNVLMYFTAQAIREVVGRFATSLAPEGYLFLGHAETLRGVSSDFGLQHSHECFYYRKRPGLSIFPPVPVRSVVAEEPTAPAASSEPGGSWLDSIRRSSDRIEAMAGGTGSGSRAGAIQKRDLSVAIEALRQERFGDALEEVARVLAAAPGALDALLLRAVLLGQGGRTDEAEAACRAILEADDLSAEAHHQIAVCREHRGDSREAIEQDQIAQYLDPRFAMPHLHLGRLARRSGDVPLARRHLAQAVELLPREDESRILYFGGGFGREALLRLCRTELEACGGRS